jgi:tyrosyl-DNA phosphodiesterase 2
MRVPFSDEPVTEIFIPPNPEEETGSNEFLNDEPVIPGINTQSALYNDYHQPVIPPVSHVPVTTDVPKKQAALPKNRPVIPTQQEMEWPFKQTEWQTPMGESRRYSLRMYRYRPRRKDWKHVSSQNRRPNDGGNEILPMSVRIFTWNINCDRRVWEDRIEGVLRHLERLTAKYKDSEQKNGHEGEACVVMLQEVTKDMLEQYIVTDKWVQSRFAIVPIEHEKWPQHAYFGNVTLVSRDLDVQSAEIVHYASSRNQRTGLVVRIRMSLTGKEDDSHVIVFGNTHLESMAAGEKLRPGQLKDMAHLLKEDDVEGGVIAGDMNAIDESDRVLGRKLGLKDAYKGKDSDPKGFTWGHYRPHENDHPPGRLDRIYYLPKRKYTVDEPTVFGADVTVTTKEDEEHSLSDHCGLATVLHVTE